MSLKKHKLIRYTPIIIGLIAILITAASKTSNEETIYEGAPGIAKIGGVNLVAPSRFIEAEAIAPIKSTNAGWMSVIPYAFCKPDEAFVNYNYEHQWWGESPNGIRKTIEYAKSHGLKVMIKPHLWVSQQGWAGDFKLSTDKEWKKWQTDYREYILEFARIGEETKAEMLCIGTECRQVVRERPQFWEELIVDVRKVYSGKLTYAANWDNYNHVSFWESLDYIGVDAYFPLSDKKTPTVEELKKEWPRIFNPLKSLSEKTGKQVIFTEYGYMSIDQSAWRNWELESNTNQRQVNLKAQANAYEAFYQSLWHEPWFGGGFLWNWHAQHARAGGKNDKAYTPQNKPVMEVIKRYYGEEGK